MSMIINSLTTEVSVITEEPGDGTKYAFLVICMKDKNFPGTKSDIAIFPFHSGATVSTTMYLKQTDVVGWAEDLSSLSLEQQALHAKLNFSWLFHGDNSWLIAAAVRCAAAAVPLDTCKGGDDERSDDPV